jgi:NAD(P)-dependent dehydrogenase (short-subunit alcohol dehydrogenase family)
MRFAQHGAAVAVLDLDQDACATAAESITASTGARTCGVAVDVSSPDEVVSAAEQVVEILGVPNVIVPNAGILRLQQALELPVADLEAVLAVNVVGSFVTATEFARRLVATRQPGAVIFSSSLFGTRGGAGNAAYSASKFAVLGMAQSMAADLAAAGIRVNSVCPGQIDSDMLAQLFRDRAATSGRTPEEERAAFVTAIPQGRLGSVDDVADTFVYLASDLSAYVTGQQIIVDGGWSVR